MQGHGFCSQHCQSPPRQPCPSKKRPKCPFSGTPLTAPSPWLPLSQHFPHRIVHLSPLLGRAHLKEERGPPAPTPEGSPADKQSKWMNRGFAKSTAAQRMVPVGPSGNRHSVLTIRPSGTSRHQPAGTRSGAGLPSTPDTADTQEPRQQARAPPQPGISSTTSRRLPRPLLDIPPVSPGSPGSPAPPQRPEAHPGLKPGCFSRRPWGAETEGAACSREKDHVSSHFS